MIIWNDKYCTGNTTIDLQHKKLVNLINELYTALKEHKASDVQNDILKQLVEYTQYHFSAEERFFERSQYPKTLEHKKIHREFIRKCEDWEFDLKSGKNYLTLDIINFLTDWLLNHILKTDVEMAKYL